MQTIGARVQIGNDHKLTLQLPESLPEGEYEVVLVLSTAASSSADVSAQATAEGQASIDERWRKWFAEVDNLIFARKLRVI